MLLHVRHRLKYPRKLYIYIYLAGFLVFGALLAHAPYAGAQIARVPLSVTPLDLSRTPTVDELMAAGQFGGQLYPTADIPESDASQSQPIRFAAAAAHSAVQRSDMHLDFGTAMQAWNTHDYKGAVELFQQYREQYPDSPWLSEVVLHLGCEARYNGRYSEAEAHFRWVRPEQRQGS